MAPTAPASLLGRPFAVVLVLWARPFPGLKQSAEAPVWWVERGDAGPSTGAPGPTSPSLLTGSCSSQYCTSLLTQGCGLQGLIQASRNPQGNCQTQATKPDTPRGPSGSLLAPLCFCTLRRPTPWNQEPDRRGTQTGGWGGQSCRLDPEGGVRLPGPGLAEGNLFSPREALPGSLTDATRQELAGLLSSGRSP